MRVADPSKKQENGVFYTPKAVAEWMSILLSKNSSKLRKNSKKPLITMDPSAGEGALLDTITKLNKDKNNMSITTYGIELDESSSKKTKQNHECVTADYLTFNNPQAENIDLIISNPPYFNVRNCTQTQRDYYKKTFKTYDGNGDILNLFMEKSLNELASGGSAIYIVQRYFLETENQELRKFLLQYTITDIIDFKTHKLFAQTGCNAETAIIAITKEKPSASHRINIHDADAYAADFASNNMPSKESILNTYKQSDLSGQRWIIGAIDVVAKITKDILDSPTTLGDICELGVGYLTASDKSYEISATEYKANKQYAQEEIIRPVIKNSDITPEGIQKPSKYWICPRDITPSKLSRQYPASYALMQQHKKQLQARPISFKNRHWYDYKGYQNPHITEGSSKVVFKSFGQTPAFSKAKSKAIYSNNVNGLIIKKEWKGQVDENKLIEYLNSKEAFAYMQSYLCKNKASGYDFKPNALRNLPVPLSLVRAQSSSRSQS